MAQTADIRDFSTTSGATEGPSLFARIWQGLVFASEYRALRRIELEAGHLISEAEMRRLRTNFLSRHGIASC